MESIKLEKPVYYNNEFALRFELGPPDVDLWIDREQEVINEKYFNIASERAISIFNSAFISSDEIKICYQIFSDGRKKIKKGDYFFKIFNDLMGKQIEFTEHRDIYSEALERKAYCLKRVTISGLFTSELDVKKMIETLINSDFGIRGPNLRGELYIVNCTKGLVFHIYDDRGMDIASKSKDSLEPIYHEQNKLLLGYDKKHMDSLFS
ncbi:hypothetical protein AKG98_3315 [Moritella sp. JT01]|uniref:DUF3885 domain-containing protein n=1 Tax=Moritella sp. JT01 TaxID=756698 RepID=UPI000794B391|nr:DUF3885 domain-containing protein [Moritella sp. JT01]KXO13099.1 hypothetical protein AKG98_3315 [Moritella sp. JT01]